MGVKISDKMACFFTAFRRFMRVVKERKNLKEALRLGKDMDDLFEKLTGKEKEEVIFMIDKKKGA